MGEAREGAKGRWFYLYVSDANMVSGEKIIDQRLADGWEPFTATEHDGSVTVHLRRWGQE